MPEFTPLWDFVLIRVDSSITSCTPISDSTSTGIVEAIGPSVERVKLNSHVVYGPAHPNKSFIRMGTDVFVLIEEAGVYATIGQGSFVKEEAEARG